MDISRRSVAVREDRVGEVCLFVVCMCEIILGSDSDLVVMLNKCKLKFLEMD